MRVSKSRSPQGREIAAFLGKRLLGKSLPVRRVSDLADCRPDSLVWVKGPSPERLKLLNDRRPALAICDPETAGIAVIPRISTARPRLDFIRAHQRFFTVPELPAIHATAIIDPGAKIGRCVSIGAYARIGGGVIVGDGSRIGGGVHLEGDIQIGRRCVIKANSVLGAPGFGFEYDERGRPLHFPHIGRIVIESDVWLGACMTVERGTLGATWIRRGSKIDDLVQIGHNVTIGRNTLVMSNVVLCGGAVIGDGCWIAPNSVVKEKIRVGNGVTVGLGAVVLKDVEDGATVVGVPAKPILSRAR